MASLDDYLEYAQHTLQALHPYFGTGDFLPKYSAAIQAAKEDGVLSERGTYVLNQLSEIIIQGKKKAGLQQQTVVGRSAPWKLLEKKCKAL